MALTLPALLQLANFPKETIDYLKDNIDYVTEDEKLKYANMAWYLLSKKYFALLSVYNRNILDEVKKGKRVFNKNDFEEVKAKLIHDLVGKLEITGSEVSMEEIRQQLETFKTKPMTQDKSVSPPPPPKQE